MLESMSRTLPHAVLLAAASSLVACTGATVQGRASAEASVSAEVTTRPLVAPRAEDVRVSDRATPLRVECAEDAAEACNALDDDCDGTVDEGCGYDGGPMQVTIAWNSDADLDLYVRDPRGEDASYQRRETRSGGHVDHAGRGACSPESARRQVRAEMTARAPQAETVQSTDTQRVENFVFRNRPPGGEYRVGVHYLFECEANAGTTTATVTLAVAGTVVGTWNVSLTSNERLDDLLVFPIR